MSHIATLPTASGLASLSQCA